MQSKTAAEYGALTSRQELRSKLQCETFEWFLRNVIPEKFVPDSPDSVLAYGMFGNVPDTPLPGVDDYSRAFEVQCLYCTCTRNVHFKLL